MPSVAAFKSLPTRQIKRSVQRAAPGEYLSHPSLQQGASQELAISKLIIKSKDKGYKTLQTKKPPASAKFLGGNILGNIL